MQSFIRQYKKQFPDELCDRLIAILDSAVELGVTRAGRSDINTVDSKIKDSIDLDLAITPELDAIDKKLFQELDQKLFGPVSNYINSFIVSREGEKDYISIEEVVKRFVLLQPPKLKVYKAPDGGYHAWHQDWGRSVLQAKRLVVAMVYLNDVEEGGETAFYHQELKVKPEKGDMVIFPPYFTHMHKGMPPISNDKYICNFYIGLAEED